MNKILLMGNPNVGKSAVFSRLTGARVVISNYPGTTVEFMQGYMKIGDERPAVIDVPGTYSLAPTSRAEGVAVEMLKQGDLVINVVDATNLERNLYLTLQLLQRHLPVIVALNMWDDTKHKGIRINAQRLEEILGVPVVPTCALTGEGIKQLIERIPQAHAPKKPPCSSEKCWDEIGEIISQVQRLEHRHHTVLERLQDVSIRPHSGRGRHPEPCSTLLALDLSILLRYHSFASVLLLRSLQFFADLWHLSLASLETAPEEKILRKGSSQIWRNSLVRV